jgi:hypothetical protein
MSFRPYHLPLSLLVLLPFVSGHGYVAQVAIDGKDYYGNLPNADPVPSIVRQINDVSPVKGADNPYLNCGQDAQLASLVANANPGSQMQFWWKGGDGSDWPHNIGPIMTYMAQCVGTTCDKYNSTTAEWFKIEETGLEPGDMVWYQQNISASISPHIFSLLTALGAVNGGPSNITLPPTLAPGQYLVRHEIIALHLANEMGGAEFYPSCTQVRCVFVSGLTLHINRVFYRLIFRVTNQVSPQQVQRSLFQAGTAMMIQGFMTQQFSTRLCSIHSLDLQLFRSLHPGQIHRRRRLPVPAQQVLVHPRPLQLHQAVEVEAAAEANADWALGRLLLRYRHVAHRACQE